MSNQIMIEGDIAYISLTQGKVAVIDRDDVPVIEGYTWHAYRCRNTFYAATHVRAPTLRGDSTLAMHTRLTGFAQVDHIDHDGLNNRRSNLRSVTNRQNGQNRRPGCAPSSGEHNISRNGSGWRVRFRIGGVLRYYGTYPTIPEAVVVRDRVNAGLV